MNNNMVNLKSNFYLEKVNSSYRVKAIYKQKFNVIFFVFTLEFLCCFDIIIS